MGAGVRDGVRDRRRAPDTLSSSDEGAFARVEQLVEQLVSPTTGVLKRAQLLPLTGGQVPYSHFAAAPARYSVLPTGGDIANPGASAWDLRRSLAQVVFEAIERYCAAFVDYSLLVLSTGHGPGYAAGLAVQRFADFQYGRAGFPYVPLRDESVIHWVLGRSLLTGSRAYVPASLTFLPYTPASAAEVIGPSMSTGMSAAWRHDDACLNGLLELVERDAFTITWMNRLQCPRLVPAAGSVLAERVAAVQADGATTVTFVDISTDIGIPVVCCLLRRAAYGTPLVTVGLSCKLDHATACDKALGEALSDHERLRVVLADPDERHWAPDLDFANVTDFEWHGRVYTDPRYQPQLDFLERSDEVLEVDGDFRTPEPGDLVDALERVEEAVSDVVMVDLTTREMAGLGVSVVKVFAPELVPLNADHRYPYLGHERLHHAGGRRPGTSMSQCLSGLNRYPHPFS